MATDSIDSVEEEDLGLLLLFSEIESSKSAIISSQHNKALPFFVHTILRASPFSLIRLISRGLRVWTGVLPALMRRCLHWLPFFRKSQIALVPPAPDLDQVLEKLRGKRKAMKTSLREAKHSAAKLKTQMNEEKKKLENELATLQAKLDKERERTQRIEKIVATTVADAFQLRMLAQDVQTSLSSARADIEANRRFALRLLADRSSTCSSSATCSICAEELGPIPSSSSTSITALNRPSATCSEGHIFCTDCLSRLARTHRFYGASGLLCPFEKAASKSNSNSNSNPSPTPGTSTAASALIPTAGSESDPAAAPNSNSNSNSEVPRWNFDAAEASAEASAPAGKPLPIPSSHVIPDTLLDAVLSPEDIAAYRLGAALAACESSLDCKICPTCNRPSLDRAQADSDSDLASSVLSCPYDDCKALFCKRCKSVANHVQLHRCQKPFRDLFVDDYMPDATDDDRRTRLLIECSALLAAADVVECPRCGLCIERVEGCRHMRCYYQHNDVEVGCRYEFCWLCGGPYPDCDCDLVNAFTGPSLADSIASTKLRTAVGGILGLGVDGDAVTALARRQAKLDRITFELRGRRELALLQEVFEHAQKDNGKLFQHLLWRVHKGKGVDEGCGRDGWPHGAGGSIGTAQSTSPSRGTLGTPGEMFSDGCDPSRSGMKFEDLVGLEVVPGPHWRGDPRFRGRGLVTASAQDELGMVHVDWVTPGGRYPWRRSRDQAVQSRLDDDDDGADPDSDPDLGRPSDSDSDPGEGWRGWARRWAGSDLLPDECGWGKLGKFEIALADPFARPLDHAPASRMLGRKAIRGISWHWGEQDFSAGNVGTITNETDKSRDWLTVNWPNDDEYSYRWWLSGEVDLIILDAPSGYDFVGVRAEARDLEGMHVTRGDDWSWGDQDLSPEASSEASATSASEHSSEASAASSASQPSGAASVPERPADPSSASAEAAPVIEGSSDVSSEGSARVTPSADASHEPSSAGEAAAESSLTAEVPFEVLSSAPSSAAEGSSAPSASADSSSAPSASGEGSVAPSASAESSSAAAASAESSSTPSASAEGSSAPSASAEGSVAPSASAESSSAAAASAESSSAPSASAEGSSAASASAESSNAPSASAEPSSAAPDVSSPTDDSAPAASPEASDAEDEEEETAPAEPEKTRGRTGLVVAVPGAQWKDGLTVPEGWVLVAWDKEGRDTNLYRWGHKGKFDLSLYVPDDLRSSFPDMVRYVFRSQPHVIARMLSAAAPKADQTVQTGDPSDPSPKIPLDEAVAFDEAVEAESESESEDGSGPSQSASSASRSAPTSSTSSSEASSSSSASPAPAAVVSAHSEDLGFSLFD